MKRIALITGGGRGIGLAIARQLATESFNIVIADVHEQTAVADALRSLEALGAEVLYCRADVTDDAARQTMLTDIRGRFGALHVLVNNAGVAPAVRADITEMSEASYERVMRINLQGPFFLTQAVANWLLEQQAADPAFSGCVINISSISAEVISISRGEYCLSKAGVSMATQLWSARLGPAGLPVYEVRPGVIMTDMTATVKDKYDKLIADGLCIQPRWGQPEDVGRACAMLARGDLPYSTGQVILVDGGLVRQRL